MPFPNPDRLVTVYDSYPKGGVVNGGVSALHYFERTAEITAFSGTALWFSLNVTLGEAGSPEPIAMMCVTPSFFRMLGVKPELGRNFLDEEGIDGKHLVAMLSDEFWRSHFNADPTVLGRTVRIDAELYTVIGVVPPGFHYLSQNPQIWGVCAFSEYNRRPDQRYRTGLEMIARLRPGATIAEAQAQVDALNSRSVPGDTLAPLVQKMGYHTVVDGLQSDHVAQWRTPLLLLQIGVLFLMLIGAVNLANLLLVRASGRTREFAVRQALGASRRQLSRTLVVETLLLATVAGVLGFGLAAVALRSTALVAADQLPPDLAPALDRHTCLAAAALTLVIGLLLALPAAWQTLRGDLATGLALGSRGGTTTRAVHRFRHGLIVAQIAFAFVLLAGVGLLGLSFIRVMAVDPGFRQEDVLTGTITLPWMRYQDAAQRETFVARLLAELRAVPGVIAVGTSTRVPFAGIDTDDFTPIDVEGRNLAPGEAPEEQYYRGVTGDYFSAMGVPLRAGRFLADDDAKAADKRCVIDETLAQRYWPAGDALGHRLTSGGGHPKPEDFSTIVGIVDAVKQNSLADRHGYGVVYYPSAVFSQLAFTVAVRTAQSPEAVATAARAAILRLDPELPMTDVKTMEDRIDDSLNGRRLPLLLAGIFAGTALVLAAVGIYGVLAYSVAQRRREIGVRMALGAQPEQIHRQFLNLGVRLLATGLPLGLIGAFMVSRAMAGLLFGIGPANPLVLFGTAAILAAVALLACLLPARRAARVSPMEALRCD